MLLIQIQLIALFNSLVNILFSELYFYFLLLKHFQKRD